MAQFVHEIRDPIHAFIRLDNDERRVLDSRLLSACAISTSLP